MPALCLLQGGLEKPIPEPYSSAGSSSANEPAMSLSESNHVSANEWDRAKAAKRGGRVRFISFDETTAEQRYALEAATDASPEKIFERRWALTVLDQVLAHLRHEFEQAGKSQQFESLKIFLTGEKPSVPYAELAARLQTTEAALKMAVQRLRHRCGELLREEIAHTVANPEQVEEEIRCLYAAMAR